MVAWLVWNVTEPAYAFDAPPFKYLNLLLSIEAITVSTFVLISQNRMSIADTRREHLNLQVNLLAEAEMTNALNLLHHISRHLGLPDPARDAEARELAARTDILEVARHVDARLTAEAATSEAAPAPDHAHTGSDLPAGPKPHQPAARPGRPPAPCRPSVIMAARAVFGGETPMPILRGRVTATRIATCRLVGIACRRTGDRHPPGDLERHRQPAAADHASGGMRPVDRRSRRRRPASARAASPGISWRSGDRTTRRTQPSPRLFRWPPRRPGTGTFPIGPFPITNGANGLLTIGGSQLWAANAIQGSGTITVTTLSATGASGTFSFNLVADAPATGTKTITNGAFNITF